MGRRLQAADERRLRIGGLAVQFDVIDPRQHFPVQRGHLHPGQVLAKTDVWSVAEREVVGTSIDAERERVVEYGFVAVRRRIPERARLALGDVDAADAAIGGGRAHELPHRRHPTDNLVDGGRHVAVGIVPELGHFTRVFDSASSPPAVDELVVSWPAVAMMM